MTSRSPRRRRRPALAPALVAALVLALGTGLAAPAGAASVTPRGAALSSSASCSQGDIEIDYAASGVERQITTFTAVGGVELDRYDVRVYASEHDDLEYILSQTRQPPAAGTLVAVHVTIGASPPDAATGEFVVAYTCDPLPGDQGGTNVVVFTCAGLWGTCPTTADEVAARLASDASPVATPVVATPTFTG